VDRGAAVVIHEIPLERRTLHGHFSRDLEPVLEIEPGDSLVFATIDAGWGLEGGDVDTRARFEPRDPELDSGHPLIGPVHVRGVNPGQALAVTIDELRVGTYGFTDAGGWPSWLNTRLGFDAGETRYLQWQLDADKGTGTDQEGRTVDLRPFLGVLGMPPAEPGIHRTAPPRACGGNLDCALIVPGTTLFLPVAVEGALFSAGDGHARQGDGEVCQLAIECPMDRVRLTLDVRPDLELDMPVVWTPSAWVTLGLSEDLDEAAALAVSGMLDLMEREQGFERRDAYALASVVVDLHVTQVVNGVKGVHAVLAHDAIRRATIPS
jgi:acetamidase/formamidase